MTNMHIDIPSMRIQEERKRLGLSIQELARLSGVHRSTLYRLEATTGQMDPASSTVRRLEGALR